MLFSTSPVTRRLRSRPASRLRQRRYGRLYQSPWQGPVALVIHNDPDPRFRLVRVERP